MYPATSRPTPDELTIMFEHCTDQPYYQGSSGMGSGRSSPATSSSPPTPTELYPHSPLDVAVASEDSWNLIPYDVPWGSEYYHYRAGTLPGPDGQCIFLRSPTPLKNRRTQKACNKCRQRKAKCSGTRPACTRCLARGYICEYVEEDKQDAKPEKRPSVSRQHRQRQCSTSSSESADASYTISDCESYSYPQHKVEEPSTPDLLYPDIDRSYESTSSPTEYGSHWDESQYTMVANYGYEHPAEAYADAPPMAEYYEQPQSYPVAEDAHAYHQHDASPMYHEVPEHHPAAVAATSVHAPRPVRCTGSPPFLSPEVRMGAFPVPADAQGMQGMQGAQAVVGMQGIEEIQHNSMLISLASGAEPAPQIAIPQVPPMAPTEPALEETAVAVEYAQPQGLYYYAPTEPAMQYPYLQYQYAVPTYTTGAAQEAIAPAMLYTMPMMMA